MMAPGYDGSFYAAAVSLFFSNFLLFFHRLLFVKFGHRTILNPF